MPEIAKSEIEITQEITELFYPRKVVSVKFNDCPSFGEMRGWEALIEMYGGTYKCYFPHDNFKNEYAGL